MLTSLYPVYRNVHMNNLPAAAFSQDILTTARTTYHIYHEKTRHKRIQTTIDLALESPRNKAKRAAAPNNTAKDHGVSSHTIVPTDTSQSFFLHKPYLAFHSPPRVLHAGDTKHGPPLLIHSSAFWRNYKIQYGDSLAATGVLDPRGVIALSHNGGNNSDLEAEDTELKGYKDRTWRLWGESGKDYVHQLKENQKHGNEVHSGSQSLQRAEPARADGVVYLKWCRPFSRYTRQYRFHYASVDFYWKGTSAVEKRGLFGMFVRFNHLKLVAAIPVPSPVDNGVGRPAVREVCLGRYVSSVSRKKCGRLELYDGALARVVEEHLGKVNGEEDRGQDEMLERRKSWLVKIIVATAMCMIASEKEKREAVGQWLEHAGEGGG
jgi:hypothetical protein